MQQALTNFCVSVRESKSISILFIATQSFGFLLQANNNMVNEI